MMEGVEEILDDSIEAESYVIRERGEEYGELAAPLPPTCTSPQLWADYSEKDRCP